MDGSEIIREEYTKYITYHIYWHFTCDDEDGILHFNPPKNSKSRGRARTLIAYRYGSGAGWTRRIAFASYTSWQGFRIIMRWITNCETANRPPAVLCMFAAFAAYRMGRKKSIATNELNENEITARNAVAEVRLQKNSWVYTLMVFKSKLEFNECHILEVTELFQITTNTIY